MTVTGSTAPTCDGLSSGSTALAAARAAIPLLALAFGGALPGFPSYSYQGPRGDASGYIETARALISAGAGLRRPPAGSLRGARRRCSSERGGPGAAIRPAATG